MNRRKILTIVFVFFVIMFATFTFYFYQMVKSPNFQVKKPSAYLKIPTGANFHTVIDSLKSRKMIHDITSFAFLSKLMKYQEHVKPGLYLIDSSATNMQIVAKLRAGNQEPVKLQFNALRTKNQLAERVSKQLEFTNQELLKKLEDPKVAEKYGFNNETFMAMFLPNTYEMYWSTSADGFLDKMKKEYDKFWTEKRKQKAKTVSLTPVEVSILAGIVHWETIKNDEKPRIAGAYLNRLKKNMLLQADPTVIFAVGDFTIRQVLNKHLKHDSPYNTYIYKGLPPGPVFTPSSASIDAVLNPEEHDYIYFCAKHDFSGYHNFAVTYSEHRQNARLYQRAYKELQIKKKAQKAQQ